jgi:hypothetical protein
MTWGGIAAHIAGVYPPVALHILTCSGTWAAPGVGFCSDAVQEAIRRGAQAIEVPVQAPWSFGPVGGGPDSPSYRESVQIGVDWACDYWLAHSGVPKMVAGYSQGAECASRIYLELAPGGRLAHLAGDFVGGFAFGNPCRELARSFPGGTDPDEGSAGISTTRLRDTPGSWYEYCEPKDMYGATPLLDRNGDLDGAGEIMREVYEACIAIGIGDPVEFAQNWLDVVQQLGENVGGGGWLQGDAGIGDAARAATIGIAFFATGTAPHIEYGTRDCGLGYSYVEHAIRHICALSP